MSLVFVLMKEAVTFKNLNLRQMLRSIDVGTEIEYVLYI